jgi:hypothetical protein
VCGHRDYSVNWAQLSRLLLEDVDSSISETFFLNKKQKDGCQKADICIYPYSQIARRNLYILKEKRGFGGKNSINEIHS